MQCGPAPATYAGAVTRARIVLSPSVDALVPIFAAIRRDAGVVADYGQAALDEAEATGRLGDTEHGHVSDRRLDLSDIEFVTIDPPGARDLDQALHLVPRGDGWRVRYAIADVGAQVIPGGAIDAQTRARGETVYCPDTRIGLHPAIMSEGYASLLPGQKTKAVVWTLDVAGDGSLQGTELHRAWVVSRQQYSYAQLAHDCPPDATELVATLARFGAARRAHLAARGGVTLPKPSQEVVVRDGHLSLEFRVPLPIEDDNAQVSLLTGEAAASLMMSAGWGIVRTMPEASAEAVASLRLRALALGVPWAEGDTYADALAKTDAETPGGAAFLVAATSLFRGAQWRALTPSAPLGEEQATHGALGAPYAHVTAPLRRLVDRFGTEACLAASNGRPVPEWVKADLESVVASMTAGSRRGKSVDRACTDAVEAAILAEHVGETFAAVGIERERVQVVEPPVVATCEGDIPVGERLEVRLISVDPVAGPRFARA